MDAPKLDIWFGPGARKGVFGAGVASGLQRCFEQGEIDVSGVRLFGSSVGCLTAVYLATGNTGHGLSIFQNDTRKLIAKSKVLPAFGASAVNRLAGIARLGGRLLDVPSVLSLEHVFDVMARRTPDVVDQLRAALMPVFAETVDRSSKFRHLDLRLADEPLSEIRQALNCQPFTGGREPGRLDSVIKGYGFFDLLSAGGRRLVIVLNSQPAQRFADRLADLMCATLSDAEVARLYLGRRRNRMMAVERARQLPSNVLMLLPPRHVRLRGPGHLERLHANGTQAAERIVQFFQGQDESR